MPAIPAKPGLLINEGSEVQCPYCKDVGIGVEQIRERFQNYQSWTPTKETKLLSYRCRECERKIGINSGTTTPTTPNISYSPIWRDKIWLIVDPKLEGEVGIKAQFFTFKQWELLKEMERLKEEVYVCGKEGERIWRFGGYGVGMDWKVFENLYGRWAKRLKLKEWFEKEEEKKAEETTNESGVPFDED
jgi:DNA-directed RNA polymerase subunit RPC12/RpoP